MKPQPRFGDEQAPPCPYDKARVAVLPVPYEGTVSYGTGASRGPDAILAASGQLESYDEELDRDIEAVGIATLPPVVIGVDAHGGGDPEGCQTESEAAPPEVVLERVYRAALPPVREGKFLLTLGGEHSISQGPLRAYLEARQGKPFSVLQLDAHADLRQSYQGTPHSHASVMARAHDMGLPLVQVGLRAVCREEREFMRKNGLEKNVFWGHDMPATPDADWLDKVVERLGEEVYITVDVDGLDPSIMPATGTPVPGGMGWRTTLALLRRVASKRRVIGADVMELAPIPGLHAPDFLAARLAQKLIGYSLAG